MAGTPAAAQAVVSTSFPDLLAEEDERIRRRQMSSYPSEVMVSNNQGENDEEVDGLLDELLNDDNDSLTNSTTSSEKATEKLNQLSPKSSWKNPTASDRFVSDNTSQTTSDRSSDHFEEEEEHLVEIASQDELSDLLQEPDVMEKETASNDNGSISEGVEEEDEEGTSFDDYNDSVDDDEESVGSTASNGTQDLLEKAHDRLNMQSLFEEVGRLRRIIEAKDKEMEEMSGQLRRAVATKCDLVIAHTELERHHEFNLQQLEEASKRLLKANFGLVEEQADTDVALMNEIVSLNLKIKEMKANHIHELGDWERLHAEEIRAKDTEIANLQEEIRKLTVGTTIARKQKQRRGMARQ